MTTTLITERLTLTPVALSDFDDLRAMWQDPEVIRHIFPDPLSDEDVWFRLLRDIGHWEALGHGNWTLRLKDTGQHVGSVGVLDFRRAMDPAFDAPELGWGLRPAFHGRGLAYEALSAALSWCEEALNAPRTVCMIDPTNAPSLSLAARAGFREYARTTYKGAPVILLERLSA